MVFVDTSDEIFIQSSISMEESVIIITQGSRYGKKITDKFLANNYKVVKTINEQQSEAEALESGTESMLTELHWNYKSPFSAKNIILNLKSYPDTKNFIIVFSMPERDTVLYRYSQIEIQKTIDLYIKSQLSIACELLNELSRNNKSATLFFVLENSNNPFKEFFKSFINTVLEDNTLPVNVNAFEAGKETPESLADYVFSILQDKKKSAKGKWFKQFRYTLF
ncbi:MAG: hypothetical protein FWD87_07460 [Spirochaetaceae bacterium]|nr:hypothetical protein [Spirochaetaceae bacterium]